VHATYTCHDIITFMSNSLVLALFLALPGSFCTVLAHAALLRGTQHELQQHNPLHCCAVYEMRYNELGDAAVGLHCWCMNCRWQAFHLTAHGLLPRFRSCLPAVSGSCLDTDPPSEWLPPNGNWICGATSCSVICDDPLELDGGLTTTCDTGM
jgi:hypothetical protein